MTGREKLAGVIIIVALVVVIGAVAWYWRPLNMGGVPVSENVATTTVPAVVSSSAPTAVPADTVVPDKGSTSTPVGVAVPVVQGAGDSAGNVSYRSFSIVAQNGSFSPDTIIVKQGDTVDLEVDAVDADYSFTLPNYGFNPSISKGKTQRIEFEAVQTGNFTFYCASCGGPSKGPVGHLIVVAP